MERIRITASERKATGKGKAHQLRRDGMIPAVAYGHGLKEPASLELPRKDLVQLLQKPTGRNTAFDLVVGDKSYVVFVKDLQVHPVSRILQHCDFFVTSPEREIHIKVPVQTVGRSKGEEMGARMFLVTREVLVSCLPDRIPEYITVDVSPLESGEVIYVDGIKFEDGVTPVYRSRYPVVAVKTVKAEVEATSAAAAEGEAAAAEGEPKPEGEPKKEG
ncbi:MAG: 50S ribosomal protein L25 [Deltaproteobacteria bacterium]|nr:50S ribosomal protein L25 [Deltaproteobacteria bacterium]